MFLLAVCVLYVKQFASEEWREVSAYAYSYFKGLYKCPGTYKYIHIRMRRKNSYSILNTVRIS